MLRPGGILVTVDRNPALQARAAATAKRVAVMAVEPDHVGLERLAELVEAGKLRVHVGEVLTLEKTARAHELLGRGGVAGKIVLTP